MQVKCNKCQGCHSISIQQAYREEDVVTSTDHGHIARKQFVPILSPGTDAPFGHETEPGSFRDPEKNYPAPEPDPEEE